MRKLVVIFSGLALQLLPAIAFAQARQETSPTLLSDYMARGVFMLWLVGVLVLALLGGAIVIVNFAFMTKRPQDRIGRRTPSDQGILKSQQSFPEAPYEAWALPAEPADEEEEGEEEPGVEKPAA